MKQLLLLVTLSVGFCLQIHAQCRGQEFWRPEYECSDCWCPTSEFYNPDNWGLQCNAPRKKNIADVFRNSFYLGAYVGGNYINSIQVQRSNGCCSPKLIFDCGYYINLALGFSMNNWFRFEEEISYRSNQVKFSERKNGETSSLTSHSIKSCGSHNAQVAAYMTNFYLDLPWCTCVWIKPYIGGGLGVAYTEIRTNQFKKDFGGHKYGFAWQGIVGFSYPICPNWDLIADFRYFRSNLPKVPSHNNSQQTFGIGVKYYFRT